MIKSLLTLFPFLFMSACFQNEGASLKKETDRYKPRSSEYALGDFELKTGIFNSLEIADEFFGNTSETISYSLNSTIEGMNFDSLTGTLSGIPLYTGKDVRNLEISLHDASGSVIATENFTLAINGDPLFVHQWHLKNTGQDGFTEVHATLGQDINVRDVWGSGITGKGIRVAVSDSGVETDHDDLYENSKHGNHLNFALAPPFVSDYPYPSSPHGTAVAGIIGARGWNNEGGIGVAPDATISGFQFLGASNFSVSEMIHQASGNHRIFNYSYGDTYYYPIHSDSFYLDHIRGMALGTPSRFYVKAAGNEHFEYSGNTCTSHNANSPMENESPYMIIVGALSAFGERSSYSNVGSNIWISAYGGEYGYTNNSPTILTTDLPTCFKGYSKVNPSRVNPFEFGHELNQLCNYTITMNGTSSAAPMVSGVLALMLEAHPNLSFRDAKHILALTAKKTEKRTGRGASYFDESLEHISHANGSCSASTHSYKIEGGEKVSLIENWTYGQGWVKNNGIYKQDDEETTGLYFHNDYGFGIIDAKKAVELTLEYTQGLRSPLPAQDSDKYMSSALNQTVSSLDYIEIPFTFNKNLTIESIILTANVEHDVSIGELGLELISPSGTRSILTYVNNSFLLGPDKKNVIQSTTHAFYGEKQVGSWRLRVVDGKAGGSGKIIGFTVDVLGH